MRGKNPELVVRARKHRANMDQVFSAIALTYVSPHNGEPVHADHQLRLTSSDNETGSAELELTTGPHILGAVSVEVSLTMRSLKAVRSTKRRASFEASPAVMRRLAAALIKAADGADRNAEALKPSLVK